MTTSADAPLQIGTVTLTVHDLEAVSDFYQTVVGLHRLRQDAAVAQLGVDDTVLLELRADRHARVRSPRDAGLFHTAFLLPTRADLGGWINRAAEDGRSIQGAADHGVSEALYLADPEGNGIEIYVDRPRSVWPMEGDQIAMVSDPLDIAGLQRVAGATRWAGVPSDTTVGHVHLQVGAIAPADTLYRDLLGFDLTCRYPGASFFGSGGYHHHLAGNIWNSRNAAPRQQPSTGLTDVQILVDDPAMFEAIVERVANGGHRPETSGPGLSLRDPWGTSLTLTQRKA